MLKLLPIGSKGEGKDVQNSLNAMLVRVANMARKVSSLDTSISMVSIDIIANFERLYHGDIDVKQVCKEIDKIMAD